MLASRLKQMTPETTPHDHIRLLGVKGDFHGPTKLPEGSATLNLVRNAIRGWMKELGGAWRTGV
jgi:hypothetical protein